ncbi:hypothetical protein ACEPAI_9722 [Sanghuangporus weigelae]
MSFSTGFACNNGASTTAFNAEGFDSCQFEQRDDVQAQFISNLNMFSSPRLPSFGDPLSSAGEEGNGFDFVPDTSVRHLGETQYLDPCALDYYPGAQQGLGLDPDSMMANPDLGMFMQHEDTNVGSLVGLDSSSMILPNQNVPSSSIGHVSQALEFMAFGPTVPDIVGRVASQGQNETASPMSSVSSYASSFSECDSIVPRYSSPREDSSLSRPQSGPSQNLPDSVNLVKTRNMTVANVATDELRITRQQVETSNKVVEVLARHSSSALSAISLKSQASKHRKSPQRHTLHDRISRTRNATEKTKANDKTTKAKTKAQMNVWHVITAPTQPSASSPTTGQIPMTSAASPSVRDSDAEATSSASNSAIVPKGPGRRKEIFQYVEPIKTEKQGKPEWCMPPPRKIHEKLLKPQPMNNRLAPGTHSDVGWVIARLREPNHGRTQFGWAIAQIHDPRLSSYLILSGPHLFKIKTVREYDRIPYSETNIDKLKERMQNKKTGAKCDKVYGAVYPNSDEIARRSSAFATMHAAGEFFVN